MPKSIVGVLVILGLLASAAATAQDSWATRSELGFVAARGNSESDSANAKIQIVREKNKWKYTLESSGLYGQSADITSAQHLDGRLQVDHAFSKRSYWFGAGRYEDDRFSGFDYQATLTTGLGRKFIDTEATKLTMQIGVGYRALRPELLIKDELGVIVARELGERDKDFVVNGSINFAYAFNDQTKLLDSLLTESGEANTLTRNDLALEVKMIKSLALAVGVSVRHNSQPLADQKRTDTLTTVNLVYVKGSLQ